MKGGEGYFRARKRSDTMTTHPAPPTAILSDAEYVLSLIDTMFEDVPQIKAHHTRMRSIAARLASPASQALEGEPSEWLGAEGCSQITSGDSLRSAIDSAMRSVAAGSGRGSAG